MSIFDDSFLKETCPDCYKRNIETLAQQQYIKEFNDFLLENKLPKDEIREIIESHPFYKSVKGI